MKNQNTQSGRIVNIAPEEFLLPEGRGYLYKASKSPVDKAEPQPGHLRSAPKLHLKLLSDFLLSTFKNNHKSAPFDLRFPLISALSELPISCPFSPSPQNHCNPNANLSQPSSVDVPQPHLHCLRCKGTPPVTHLPYFHPSIHAHDGSQRPHNLPRP